MALLSTTVGMAEAQPQPDLRRDQRPIDVAPDAVRDRPVQPFEQLRLSCDVEIVGDHRGVLCRWSPTQQSTARAYQLYRIVDGSPRRLLTTVGADGRLAYFDTDLSAPSEVTYGVVALSRNGRVIGIGGPVRVQIGTDLRELRFGCTPDSIGDQRGVLCRWSESTASTTRGYLVYRSIDQGPREVIARIGLDGRRAHFDTAVVPGSVHIYAVVAVDSAGNPLAIGGPQRLQWPPAG
jgi:hypothetical protein